MSKQVRVGFNPRGVTIPIVNILPVRQLKPIMKESQKYHQILSSVREVGIIEPLIVFPQNGGSST
jgi:ParB-like chromosome segregation protein Spo0J